MCAWANPPLRDNWKEAIADRKNDEECQRFWAPQGRHYIHRSNEIFVPKNGLFVAGRSELRDRPHFLRCGANFAPSLSAVPSEQQFA
jgi:hypothetical protein